MTFDGNARAANLMFDFIASINQAQNSDEVLNQLHDIATAFGFESFAISGIPLPSENIDPYVLLNGWPEEWFERYVAEKYVHIDPVIYQAKISDEAFIWSEVLGNRPPSVKAKKLMNEASEFRMRDGFCVPLHLTGGFQALVTFAGVEIDLSLELRSVLQIVAIYAHNRLRLLLPFKKSHKAVSVAYITPHERDVIRWCAEGKTNWEIGAILGRSEKTVQHELHNAQRKLNCVNRAQLVAEAIRIGVIR
jgi:LuxR family transcriptional regulator, quorum-sensing system regulator BjaR1